MDFKKFIKKENGYTLTELMIYVGLFAIISGALITFLVTTINVKLSIDTTNNFTQESRIILDTITKEMRESYNYDIQDEGTKIVLYKDDAQTTESQIYIDNGTVYLTRENGETNGISSGDLKVQELLFEDYTSTNSRNLIHLRMTIKNLDTQKYPPIQDQLELSTSVNFRNGLQD
ncbi:prepilin-type N-terminal cleavage/methylation domain-containing protein [Candidatus Dojkabacteria bacterium]|uniref:Prepilin-type N-terminal cleavage/methylation domain-containing protein n=1 Tax=Candidatus Dojkabacteria bacterium TaxID=2099670 RepID=A0A955RIM4_9BACT|nr:prepilin-type N-terminal cleavage/methylation domain-containing protein [Candidatus Dojkabacteria bacterium]